MLVKARIFDSIILKKEIIVWNKVLFFQYLLYPNRQMMQQILCLINYL